MLFWTAVTWGLDLSGSTQGAGGVGGLLADTACNKQPLTCNTCFPCYDANGNVTDYVDASGNLRARYAYSAFGETTAQSGDMAGAFTHRFSTKPFDTETGVSKYQLRDYLPGLGRWASRDPIGESGGENLFCVAGNDTLDHFDIDGLVWSEKLEGSDFYISYSVGVKDVIQMPIDVFKGGSAHFEYPGWKEPEFDKTSDGCPCIKDRTGILNVHIRWWEVRGGVPSPEDYKKTEGWRELRKKYGESALLIRTGNVGSMTDQVLRNMNWHERTEVGINEKLYENTLGKAEKRINECYCSNLTKTFEYQWQLEKYINYSAAKKYFVQNTNKIRTKFDNDFGFSSFPNMDGSLTVKSKKNPSAFNLEDFKYLIEPPIW